VLVALLATSLLAAADIRAGENPDEVAVDLAAEIDKVAHVPERFAVEVSHRFDLQSHGHWQTAEGARTWRYTLRVPGAVSLSFHAQQVALPGDAVLNVQGRSETFRYSSRDIHRGELWSRIAQGDTLDFSLTAGSGDAPSVVFVVNGVQAGFRSLGGHGPNHPHYDALQNLSTPTAASTTSCVENFECHLTSGDTGPGQASVTLVIANLGLCSGVLLNDVPGDGIPYVLTARHCENGSSDGGDPSAASGVTAYFDATTPCGQTLNSIYSANTVGITGATTVVEQQDAWLIRLDSPVPVSDAFYAGWDATGGSFVGGYTAHYADGNTRQYTGWYGQAYYQQVPGAQLGVHYTSTLWDLVNQAGSIGPGASGSGVFDPNDHMVGTVVRGIAQSSQAGSPGVCPSVPLATPSPQTATGLATALSGIFDSTTDPQSTTGSVTLQSVLDPHGSGVKVLDGKWLPVVFNASSTASLTGSLVTLSWNASGSTSCTAAGGQAGDGWSGTLAASGSVSVTEYNAGIVTYNLTCPRTVGGQSTSQVTVTWSLASPSATIQFAPISNTFVGTQLTLEWSSTVSACTATGGSAGDGWSGSLPARGTQMVTETTAGTFTYGIVCGSGARTASAQVQFTFVAPSATLQDGGISAANIGQPITLIGSGNGLSCYTSGGASGDGWAGLNFLGLGMVYTLTEQTPGTYTYTWTCTGNGTTSASGSVTVTFSNGPPKVTLTTSPGVPTVGTSFLHVSWVANVGPCSLSVTGYSNNTLSNFSYVGYYDDSENVIGPYTYTVTCGSGVATASATATVNWGGTPKVTLVAYTSPVVVGQPNYVTWFGNAAPCVASGGASGDGWTGSSQSATAGLQVTESQPGTYTYNVACGSGAQVAQAQATVVVNSGSVFVTLVPSATTGSLGGPAVTLTWNSNTSPCLQAGGGIDAWRQSTASSGSALITEVDPGSYNFSITCGGGLTYSASAQVTLVFTGPTRPAFTTSTNYANAGLPFTLSWQSSDGSSCTALAGSPGDGWTGALPPSGSKQIIEMVPGPYAYQIKCGVAGIALLGVEVYPAQPAPQPPPPTSVQMSSSSASAFVNQQVSLTWSSTSATSCNTSGGSGSDGWQGGVPPAGTQQVMESTAGSYIFEISCSGTGVASAQATVTFNPPLADSLTASSNSVTTGESFKLTWSSSEATSCNASGGSAGDGWQGSEPLAGSMTITESTLGTYTYTITCTAGQTTAQSSAQVIVTAARSSSGGGGGGSLEGYTLVVLLSLLVRRCLVNGGSRHSRHAEFIF